MRFGLPTDWPYRETSAVHLLSACNELVVLMLPGWREGVGVQVEIDLALELDLPIRYLEPATRECMHITSA